MKKLIKFPKIGQYRNLIYDIKRKCEFTGLDNDGEATFDESLEKPKLTAFGTVKLHGTNASVVYNHKNGVYAQSKGSLLTVEEDNHNFAKFVEKNKEWFKNAIIELANKNNIDLNTFSIALYGEWVGIGIQKKVAISKIDKSLFLIGAKVSHQTDEEFTSYWIDFKDVRNKPDRIFNILDYKTFEIDIDFNSPKESLDILEKLTLEVEKECPVAKEFGIIGIGEGIVWTVEHNGQRLRMKTKGEEHSGKDKSNKLKKVATVDIEKMNSIKEFVDYSATESRFQQSLENVFKNGERPTIKKMGNVIKWVVKDILEEESDVLKGNNLEDKDVTKYISNKVRDRFKEYLDETMGL